MQNNVKLSIYPTFFLHTIGQFHLFPRIIFNYFSLITSSKIYFDQSLYGCIVLIGVSSCLFYLFICSFYSLYSLLVLFSFYQSYPDCLHKLRLDMNLCLPSHTSTPCPLYHCSLQYIEKCSYSIFGSTHFIKYSEI